MPRAQNAHAYVNAGFLFEMNENRDKINNATAAFGGIRPEVSFQRFNYQKICS